MQDRPLEIIVDVDAVSLQERFDEMLSAYQDTLEKIQKAFSQVDMSAFEGHTVRLTYYTKQFSNQLQYLRMNLGRLRAALQNAFAPIGAVVLPVINKAISYLVSLLHTVQAVVAALVDTTTGTDSAAAGANKAAKAYKSLGSAARRSLAGFDQIERLNGGSGSSVSSEYNPLTVFTQDMSRAAAKLLELLQPLLEIDFGPLQAALGRLWESAKPLLSKLGDLLSWLWQGVLTPFITWCAEALYPALADTFGSGLSAAGSAATSLIDCLKLLWNALQPVVSFIREAVLTALQAWQQVFGALSEMLGEKGPEIATVFHNLGQVFSKIWAVIGPILSALYTQFQATFAGLGAVAAQTVGAILEGLAGITEFLTGIFTGDWNRAWNGILYAFKGMINSLIGLMNALLTKLTGTLNGIIRLISAMQIKVPSWVPGIGGQSYSFGFQTVSAPQIPYLARGAVLPANKPFLAMVGDQKHGTNIEAPLTTIQEALGAVMGDYVSANLAGHRATVGVLQEILQAVLGIEIGDEVIAAAASRHQAKMAIVRGG